MWVGWNEDRGGGGSCDVGGWVVGVGEVVVWVGGRLVVVRESVG